MEQSGSVYLKNKAEVEVNVIVIVGEKGECGVFSGRNIETKQ